MSAAVDSTTGSGLVNAGGGRPWTAAIPPAAWAAGALVFVSFCGLFFRWGWKQHRLSAQSPEDWGHAYLIPLISLYVIWLMRKELAQHRPSIFWPGLAPMLLGIMSYFCCVVIISNHMLQGFAAILTLLGAALTLLGPAMMRLLFLPISFLVFAVTISQIVMTKITFQLQLIASQGAHLLLSLLGAVMGFGVDVEGNVLTMISPDGEMIPLNVAEACSGMRMVIAFFALAGATALLGTKQWWQRLAIIGMAAPVAVFMNVVRVAILGLLSLWDPDLAAGDAHTFIGTLLLIPALGLFLASIWALNKAVPDSDESQVTPAKPTEAS
ncbi:MAG: exosortase/archaeosortase family protein [Planctomycetota bacterium]